MFDRDMRYVAVSRRWLADYSLGEQDLIGRSHYEVFPEIPERWKKIHLRCLAGAVEECDEDPFPRADGKVDWVRWEVHPWRHGNGEIQGIVIFSEQITERKLAREALTASENRFRALLDSASQGVVAIDESGRMVLVNARTEEMFGYTRDELLGQPLDMLLPERFRNAHGGHLQHYFAHPRVRAMGLGMDLCGLSRNGDEIPLEVSLSSIEQSGSRLAMALITDISERKKAEKLLRESQKLESLGLLAGGVAHDFNNLLVGVIGNASLAQEMLPPGHPAAGLMAGVLRSGEQAAHLTRQMLAYSGKGRFLVEPLDLSALIPEMSGLVRPSIPKKVALKLDLAPNLPAIEADRGQVQQVFMNFVLNAGEAIGSQEGSITVRTGVQEVGERFMRLYPEASSLRPGRYVYLEVSDTGCGMDEATKARIFDPFFSTKFLGRGLGLAAVAGILRGHQGAITVSSEPGKGSCFTALFQASERAAGKSALAAHQSALQGAGVVLVVDDEEVVLVADSGRAAIDIFRRHPAEIALVILDLSMPGMNGDEALPELRKIRPGMKVLLASGFSESEAMALLKGQPVSGFIQKPYTSGVLAEKVKGCLG
jgi:PAS domain S-box-containing protein